MIFLNEDKAGKKKKRKNSFTMGKGEMYGIVGTSEITMGDYVSDFMKVTRSIRQGIFFTFVLYFLF